jgi:hypothetical protein
MNDADLIAEIIAEKIDPADIIHLVTEMAKLRDEGGQPSWFAQVGILADKFPAHSRKPVAIMERMRALVPMLKDKRARGWSFDGVEPGCIMAHEAMLRATALTPLHCLNGTKFKFQREEFFKVALEQTDAHGPVA